MLIQSYIFAVIKAKMLADLESYVERFYYNIKIRWDPNAFEQIKDHYDNIHTWRVQAKMEVSKSWFHLTDKDRNVALIWFQKFLKQHMNMVSNRPEWYFEFTKYLSPSFLIEFNRVINDVGGLVMHFSKTVKVLRVPKSHIPSNFLHD